MNRSIMIFGNGYVAKFLTKKFTNLNWSIYCTSRKMKRGYPVQNRNTTVLNFLDPLLPSLLKKTSVIVSTIPPYSGIVDPVLKQYNHLILQEQFDWVGYLSSTGVYGNHDGNWVDETTKCHPTYEKSVLRLKAENQWLNLYEKYNVPVHILRLSGIYGPHRNCLEQIRKGKQYTIVKKNHCFSRIHVDDICMAIYALINHSKPGQIFNISDDEPTESNIVHQFAAKILNLNSLQEKSLGNVHLSEQVQSFYNDNKKVSSRKIKEDLNIQWQYPNYRIGLKKGCLPFLS